MVTHAPGPWKYIDSPRNLIAIMYRVKTVTASRAFRV